jgi:2-iminobutanoate/2-iminopropanoate deaminase
VAASATAGLAGRSRHGFHLRIFMSTTVTYPRAADTPTSHLPFSPVVRVGDIVFVSGQASVDTTGKLVPDTFEGEFRRSIENMRLVLKAAGCDLKDVVQTRNYVRDPADVPRYNELYREYFTAPYPTRTTITNCPPPTLKYEVECVAVAKS